MRGGAEFDKAREDMRLFGATGEQLDKLFGPEQRDCEIWPENWEAVQAFLAVQTQWNISMSGPTGLDYARVRAGLDLAGITATPEIFQKLRTLESAALKALAKKGNP